MFKFENRKIIGKHFSFKVPCCFMPTELPSNYDPAVNLYFNIHDNIRIKVAINETSGYANEYILLKTIYNNIEVESEKQVERGKGTAVARIYTFRNQAVKEVYEEVFKVNDGKEKYSFMFQISDNMRKLHADEFLKFKEIQSFLNSVEYF